MKLNRPSIPTSSMTNMSKMTTAAPTHLDFDFGFDSTTAEAAEQKPTPRPRFYLDPSDQAPTRSGVVEKLARLGNDILTINAILLGFGSNEKVEQDAQTIFWSERRIKHTVTPEFILNNIPTTTNQKIDLTSWLKQPVGFGDLTDETYMEWILSRAQRLFLILVRIGIPEQIFGIIDDSWDDDDLPFAIKDVPKLKLDLVPNKDLDEAFWKTQYTVLLRTLNRGKHIDYHTFETVPVEVVESHPQFKMDKIAFPDGRFINRYFARKTVPTTHLPDMMNHIEAVKSKGLDNANIVEFFASYTLGGTGHLVFYPYATMTLASFMYSPSYLYAALPPAERAVVVMRWISALADAISYLHALDLRHGDIRPSSIMVIEDGAKVLLADSGREVGIIDTSSNNQTEADEYGAPEDYSTLYFDSSLSQSATSLSDSRMSIESASKSFRIGFRGRPSSSRNSSASSSSGSDSKHSSSTIRPSPLHQVSDPNTLTQKDTRKQKMPHVAASSPYTLSPKLFPPTFSPHSEIEHWGQPNRLYADVFSLGCIFVDILTFLSPKRKLSQFRTRRSRARGINSRPSFIRDRLSSYSSSTMSTTSSAIDPYSRPGSPSSASIVTSSSVAHNPSSNSSDSSFRANLPTVHEWCNVLLRDTDRKDANKLQVVLVQDVVTLCRGMLQESPETRKSSADVYESLEELRERDFGAIDY